MKKILFSSLIVLTGFFTLLVHGTAKADVIETCTGTAYAPIGHSTTTLSIVTVANNELKALIGDRLFPVRKEQATGNEVNPDLINLYADWSQTPVTGVQSLIRYSIYTSGDPASSPSEKPDLVLDVLRNSANVVVFAGYSSKDFPGIQFYHFCAPFQPRR